MATIDRFRLVVWILALVVTSCSDYTNPIGPLNRPEISNSRDIFQFDASNLARTTQTQSFAWQNTGTFASVNQSGKATSGSATLTIRNPEAADVYTRDLSIPGTFTTGAGSPGNWRIELRLDHYTGTLAFRVQKP